MTKLTIRKKFFIFFFATSLLIGILTKLFYISTSSLMTNVNYINSDNPLMHILPYITKYSYLFFDIAFSGFSVAGIAYARTYFGPKTSYISASIALGSYIISQAFGFIYNLIYNSLSSGAVIALALSYAVEILFMVVLLMLTPIIVCGFINHYAKRSPLLAYKRASLSALLPLSVSLLFRLLDLTAFKVIPHFIEYKDTTAKEVFDIASDYVYYLSYYFVIPAIISVISYFIFKKITGTLKLKIKGA